MLRFLERSAVGLLALAACSGEPRAPAATPARIRAAPELVWQTTSLALEPDGRSAPWTFELPDGARVFAVRSSLADAAQSAGTCFQLEEVAVQGGGAWVGAATSEDFGDYCLRCRERVAVGAGYGLSVLPSGPDDALVLRDVTLRVALRDCATLTPLAAAEAGTDRVQAEQTSWRLPPVEQHLSLPVAVVVASTHGFAADPQLLAAALSRLQLTWSAAGIEIAIAAKLEIDAVHGAIAFTPNERSELVSLAGAARAALAARSVSRAWPVIVLTGCLRRTDPITRGRSEPLAITPHLPGGFGVHDEPDLIFVAAERCEEFSPGPRFLDADTLGAVIAHELGHWLGLFHVRELDGRADVLSDTSADELNLMQVMPSPDALTLTDSQIHIARRHIVFADETP